MLLQIQVIKRRDNIRLFGQVLPPVALISPPVGASSHQSGANAAHRRRSCQAQWRSEPLDSNLTFCDISAIQQDPHSSHLGAIGDIDPAVIRGAHVDPIWRDTMQPRGPYQALSSRARTAATLAPSVILTRPSSEVPMLTPYGDTPCRRAARIRPCPAGPAPQPPWRRR